MPERVSTLRKKLREEYWNKPVANQTAAHQLVEQICNLSYSTAGLKSSSVIMEYVFGGCNALDDYSSYMTPDKLGDLYSNIEGEFVGLGIEMKAEEGKGMLLVNVLSGSPAEEGGMSPGEHIVGIGGVDCRDMSTDEAARLLRGVAESRVRLKLFARDGNRQRETTFVRRAVLVKSIPVIKMVDTQNGVGYIQMTGFQRSSATELDVALTTLRRQGMRS